MTAASPPPPPAAPAAGPAHSPEHEERLLAALSADPAADDPQRLAERLATCDDCLAAALRTLDTLLALSARAGRPAGAAPAAVARLEALLDDAMVLRAWRSEPAPEGPGGEQRAEPTRARDSLPLAPRRR